MLRYDQDANGTREYVDIICKYENALRITVRNY